MGAAGPELARRHAATDEADDGCGEHDQREGQLEREDRDEGSRGDPPQHIVLQRARANAMRRLHDDRRDRRLDTVEQSGDQRHIAEDQVDPRQRDEDEQRGQHEQRAGHDAAGRPVHQPADVGGKLLCFGAWQHHAGVQCMQEAALRNPVSPFDEFLVHDRDLAGRAAEADEAEFQPE